jgi:hypothetical protein
MGVESYIEGKEPHFPKERFKPQKLWRTVKKAWPGARIVNQKDNISSAVKLVEVLCPLYGPSNSLSESVLIEEPKSLNDSRVGIKWTSGMYVKKGIKEYLQRVENSSFEELVIFADKGVISSDPSIFEEEKIRLHEEFYRKQVEVDMTELGISYSFETYSSLGVVMPTFIAVEEDCPFDLVQLPWEHQIIERVKRKLLAWDPQDLRGWNLSYSNKMKRIMPDLIGEWGEKDPDTLTVGLIASYLAFDPLLPSLGNVYMVAERAEGLFHLTQFDIQGEQSYMPTIQLSC